MMAAALGLVAVLVVVSVATGWHLLSTRDRGDRLADARPEPRTLEDWRRESARSLRRARHRR